MNYGGIAFVLTMFACCIGVGIYTHHKEKRP